MFSIGNWKVVFEDQLSQIDPKGYGDRVTIYSYNQVIRLGEKSITPNAELPIPSDTAIIMYTSGSTGKQS